MKKDLTEFIVYNAMIFFLYEYEKKRYGYGTLQEILKELSPLPGGGTSNPAVWVEWKACVNKSLKEILETEPIGEASHRKYTELQAFNAMVVFFINYYKRTSSGDLRILMEVICPLSENSAEQASWNDWDNAARKALQKQNIKKTMKNSAEKRLTELQAFNTMVKFLEGYYKETRSEFIVDLLSSFLFLPDGKTADLAFWSDWENAIKTILKKHPGEKQLDEILGVSLTESQAFKAMAQFFRGYYELTSNPEAMIFLDNIHLLPNGNSTSSAIREKWKRCVDESLKEKPGIRKYRIICLGKYIAPKNLN